MNPHKRDGLVLIVVGAIAALVAVFSTVKECSPGNRANDWLLACLQVRFWLSSDFEPATFGAPTADDFWLVLPLKHALFCTGAMIAVGVFSLLKFIPAPFAALHRLLQPAAPAGK